MNMIKKIALFLGLTVAFFSQVKANDADLFNYDRNVVENAVSALTSLENYVSQNPTITVDQLKTSSLMVNGLIATSSPFGMFGEPPLGIPSFLWGCVFGVIGVVIVYIATDNDKAETKKALWGCVTSTAVGILFYVLLWGALFATADAVTTTPGYY